MNFRHKAERSSRFSLFLHLFSAAGLEHTRYTRRALCSGTGREFQSNLSSYTSTFSPASRPSCGVTLRISCKKREPLLQVFIPFGEKFPLRLFILLSLIDNFIYVNTTPQIATRQDLFSDFFHFSFHTRHNTCNSQHLRPISIPLFC